MEPWASSKIIARTKKRTTTTTTTTSTTKMSSDMGSIPDPKITSLTDVQ